MASPSKKKPTKKIRQYFTPALRTVEHCPESERIVNYLVNLSQVSIRKNIQTILSYSKDYTLGKRVHTYIKRIKKEYGECLTNNEQIDKLAKALCSFNNVSYRYSMPLNLREAIFYAYLVFSNPTFVKASFDENIALKAEIELSSSIIGIKNIFTNVKITSKRITAVTPKAIVLQADNGDSVNFGKFRIVFDLKTMAGGRTPFSLEPLTPNLIFGTYSHPHVCDGNLCMGDGRDAICRAVDELRLLDAFELIYTILQNYGEGRAYTSLDNWIGSKCYECDGRGGHYDCSCGHTLCENCCFMCSHCEATLCSSCRFICTDCEEDFCEDHIGKCAKCKDYTCKSCLVEHNNHWYCSNCRDGILEEEANEQEEKAEQKQEEKTNGVRVEQKRGWANDSGSQRGWKH